MEFVFVQNKTIHDKKSRKLIRSHCMKGKNIGKTRIRRTNVDDEYDSRIMKGSLEIDESKSSLIRSAFDNRFATVCFPSRLDENMHEMLYLFLTHTSRIIYPEEYCHPKSARNGIWFSLLVQEEAFFHCILAMAAGLQVAMGNKKTSKELLKHLGNTYHCINKSLQYNKMPSDSIVASVMSIAIHEDLLGHPQNSKVHMNALYRMVDMKGGLEAFQDIKTMQQKLSRADLEHSLQLGQRPHFYHDEFPRQIVESTVEDYGLGEQISDIVNGIGINNEILRGVFTDITSVSYILARRLVKFDPFAFQEILISVLFRLLHLYPLSEPGPNSKVDNLCHLGLLAFMSTMLFQPGIQRLPYALLTEKFRLALRKMSASTLMDVPLLFWMQYIGGISVLRGEDRSWLLPCIEESALSLGLSDWNSAQEILHRYPWVRVFHDDSGQSLWDQIHAIDLVTAPSPKV